MARNNDNQTCSSPDCPVTAIVGAHTAGISVSGPAGNASCAR